MITKSPLCLDPRSVNKERESSCSVEGLAAGLSCSVETLAVSLSCWVASLPAGPRARVIIKSPLCMDRTSVSKERESSCSGRVDSVESTRPLVGEGDPPYSL